MRSFRQIKILFVVLLLSTFAAAARAQADPPERVARLNLAQGSVSYLPSGGGDNDWVAAVLNRPLTIGDRLWTDDGARAELHIGSTAIQLDSNTGISFLNLDDSVAQMQLSDGSIALRVRNLGSGETLEVDTSNLAFVIQAPGTYRLDAHPDDNATVVTVREGQGEVTGGGRSWQVISDQQVILTGSDTLSYDLKDADAQPMSDFDNWVAARDSREDSLQSKYVSADTTGYEDLSDASYGTWSEVPDYGWCWRPVVAVGWAPYRFGHWVWVAPWGWTWVEDEPWGFAPFHYGRWAFWGSAWYWVPGPIAVRPIYAPALVAWIGGGGFGVSIGVGAVGWFPLGPREVFVPTYHVSEAYVTRVNITNTIVARATVVNIYNQRNVQSISYANQHVAGGVTVVSHDTFVNARSVRDNTIHVDDRAVVAARVSHDLPAQPERASVYGAGAHGAPHPAPEKANRSVIAKQPPAVQPNHFAAPENSVHRPDYRPFTRGDSQPPANQAGHAPDNQQNYRPQVRQAPPVRQPTPEERSSEESKQRAWQNAHPRPNNNNDKKGPGRG
jgi:hypothetical protein